MAPVQVKIREELKKGARSVNELVKAVAAANHTSEQEVRSAVLPMISSELVELTSDLKLRLRHSA